MAATGARAVTTVDYVTPVSASPRIAVLSMAQLQARPATFDAVFSFSSVEHDGLGRCECLAMVNALPW